MTKNVGTHRTHCCLIHGCKYGDPNCPVVDGEVMQEYLCEDCNYENIRSVDDVISMHQLGIRKCHECGSLYIAKKRIRKDMIWLQKKM